jgi:erythromycin esterase
VVQQGEQLFAQAGSGGAARDTAMAENVTWLLDQAGPGAKIVLWAHNGHVSTRSGAMGYHLRQKYGDQLVTVGFDFFQGAFRAVGLQGAGTPLPGGPREYAVTEPPRDSYEGYFQSAGLHRFAVDLRALSSNPKVQDWFATRHNFRSIGCCFYPDRPHIHVYQTRLQDEFDVIIYFESTTSSVPVQP